MANDTETERQLRIDYWADVKAMALDAKSASDPDEHVLESVDGSEWIIYTYRNVVVLQESPNGSAAFEDDPDCLAKMRSYGEVMARLAYSAMLADVREALAELPEDEEPEEGA